MDTFINRITHIAILGMLFLSVAAPLKVQAQDYGYQDYSDNYDNSSVSLQTFYDDLAPYGQWVEDPAYGYVWVPDVSADFRPYYTYGHWVMTDYGNTWVSNYPWGWAAFHYGRWTYDNYYGWIWIPGTVWGPAWVSWRYGNGYYGWAPLGPDFDMSMGFGYYDCPVDWWVFIQPMYLYKHNYYRYWHPRNNSLVINNTSAVNNTYTNTRNNVTYVTGPRATEIQNVTNQPVTVYHIRSTSAPVRSKVRDGEVTMFHPMQVKTSTGRQPVPADVVHAPQAIGRPQPAMNTDQQPAFRTPQLQQRNNFFSAPVSQPSQQQPTRGRYEWNPQSAPQQRQQQQNNFQQNNSFSRPQPQVQPQNFNRPQPVMQAPRSAPAPQRMEAPRAVPAKVDGKR